MTSDQFFYWLQGYFELSGTQEALSIEQGECVARHIELVSASQPSSRLRDALFCERIVEIRTLLTVLDQNRGYITNEIRKRISDEFIHVIDPKAGGVEEQEKLNTLHGKPILDSRIPPPPKLGGPLMRC